MKATGKFWMMKSASGALVAHTVSYTRHGALEKVASMHSPTWHWKRLYRHGARIVRVHVKEI